VEREGRLPPEDDGIDDDFSLDWAGIDDPAAEGTEDVLDISGDVDEGGRSSEAPAEPVSAVESDPTRAVPWDELGEETTPTFEEQGFVPPKVEPVPRWADDAEPESASAPVAEAVDDQPPQGDPLETAAETTFEPEAEAASGDAFERPAARMDSLQDALASIRERVQTLTSEMEAPAAAPAGGARTSELSLYRQATDDRTLRELRRHSGETEELLRRMSGVLQDLSMDLRSIVDAARRAIDQTSEQADSSIELGRLLGERIEQLDEEVGARIGVLDKTVAKLRTSMGEAMSQLHTNTGKAFNNMQTYVDKRFTKLEQRAGVGVVREELGEIRSDVGDMRTELGEMRTDVGDMRTELSSLHEIAGEAGGGGGADDEAAGELAQRIAEVDRTLATLTALIEETPEDAEAGVGLAADAGTAVETFRAEVEDLGRQLGAAIEREEQLTVTLAALTEEVRGLRKRIGVRASPPTIGDDQIQAIVDAVVAALPGRRVAALEAREARPEREPEPEAEAVEEPAPARAKRERPARSRRSRPLSRDDVPGKEDKEEEAFAAAEPELPEEPDEDEEEPIRRARGGKRASKPVVKGRRARSGSR
jgi:methyl-accepting chemotaxis protein